MIVSRETSERLDLYAALLAKWNPAINLVSRSTLADVHTRHFKDSAQLFDLIPEGSKQLVDLGSGGGFPGMVIAIIAMDSMPRLKVTLVESDARKAAFLATVSRETGARAEVIADRIEAIAPLNADVLTARALASLPRLCAHAERHLAADGIALFPKGASHASEVAEALAEWRFDLRQHASRTDPGAVILELRGISRA